MKKLLYCCITISILLIGCASYRADQLAGRHWIKNPETGKKVWAPQGVWYDKDFKVWRWASGEVCGDGYLYEGN